jgi:hypothetical protein
LSEVARRVGRLMFSVELAHRSQRILCAGSVLNGFGYFRPDLHAQWVRSTQLLIVAAGVDRGQDREQSLAGIERYVGLVLSNTGRCQTHRQNQNKRKSKTRSQEILQIAGADR